MKTVNCSNCAYFEENGMEKGKHLCVLKEIVIKTPEKERCEDFEED